MIMKKRIILFLAIITFSTACNDDFLDVDPLDRQFDTAVWTNKGLIDAFVKNIYMGLHHSCHPVMLSSVCDESMAVWGWETTPVLNGTINQSYHGIFYHWSASFDNLRWGDLYSNIRACNIYLQNIETAAFKDDDDIKKLTGEVYFLRAHLYYWLMSFHGGVPLIDKPYGLDDDYTIARSTFEETIDFIVSDLNTAADLLPITGDKAQATKGAALTLKSRVLLYAASDLFNSNGSWTSGYAHPELISYTDISAGARKARWEAAKDAAQAVMDLGVYSLYGGTSPSSAEQATENYANIFLNTGNQEDIFLSFYDVLNWNGAWNRPNIALFNSPNGWNCWGGNTPIGQFVDSYEMSDGSKFDWNNPTHAVAPYENRDPRFYASIQYDGAKWKPRPAADQAIDPIGIVQTGFYQNADLTTTTPGLDTRKRPNNDWNGTYTGYYLRKFIDPAVYAQFKEQLLPWRQMRYAEVLLNYAEACIELAELGEDTEAEAKDKLNMIRQRAAMPDITETGTALRDRYRNERKIELAYENHRYFDIRRWMIAPSVINNAQGIDIFYPYGSSVPTYTIKPNVEGRSWHASNKSYFLPLILGEINKNPLLIQNPGY